MRSLSSVVGTGLVGWVVMATGGLLVLVGIIALLVGADPSPTAAAILAGATLVGVGGTLARDTGVDAAEGGVWRALAGDTASRADVMAAGLPEHLRGLFVDLARGTAAARYLEMSKVLRRQLSAGAALPPDTNPMEVVAAAVREMSRASTQEAWDAVSGLRGATDDTTVGST